MPCLPFPRSAIMSIPPRPGDRASFGPQRNGPRTRRFPQFAACNAPGGDFFASVMRDGIKARARRAAATTADASERRCAECEAEFARGLDQASRRRCARASAAGRDRSSGKRRPRGSGPRPGRAGSERRGRAGKACGCRSIRQSLASVLRLVGPARRSTVRAWLRSVSAARPASASASAASSCWPSAGATSHQRRGAM